MTYKMSGLRQDVTLLQQVGEPIYTQGEGGGYYGGKINTSDHPVMSSLGIR